MNKYAIVVLSEEQCNRCKHRDVLEVSDGLFTTTEEAGKVVDELYCRLGSKHMYVVVSWSWAGGMRIVSSVPELNYVDRYYAVPLSERNSAARLVALKMLSDMSAEQRESNGIPEHLPGGSKVN